MLPDDLRTALDSALARYAPHDLSRAVDQLTERYRTGHSADAPHLRTPADIAAYAAYRMPATYAACATVMRQAAARTPGFLPRTHLDVGGGTGAALWAAGEVWPSLERATVLEHDRQIIDLGSRLAREAPVREVTWRHASIRPGLDRPAADLVTMSYALNELPPDRHADVVRWLAQDSGMVVIVEPGTPAGYANIATARQTLTESGLNIVAPCPHDGPCPIQQGRDWCHFSVRLPRSPLHRRVKSGTLGFEDEKFSYVAAVRGEWSRAAARVLRHPQKRKGVVALRLCTEDDGVRDVIVSKRQGEVYRLARDVDWGDDWSPADR
ncbi:MAG: rRNA methyltransferase [Nonomuraea sp.]|nr:rRNA methyltransferase [Nonomuraea sp.]